MKSASTPPYGGAQEPGSYSWCSIRIVPINYQSKRRDMRTAVQRRRYDVVVVRMFFCWEDEPQQKLKNTVITSLNVCIWATEPRQPIYGVPLPLIQYSALYCTAPTLYIPCRREACDEPLIYPPSYRLTAWTCHTRHFVFPYILSGREIGDLGWGPRIRHLVSIGLSRCSFRVEGHIGLDHAASGGTAGGVYTRTGGRGG